MIKGRLFSEGFISFVKQRKNLMLILIAALGVGLVAASLFTGGAKTDTKNTADSLEEYRLNLEGELAELCSAVYGVGRCRVRVSFSSGFRYEYKGSALTEKLPPEIDGVTVLCDGADSSEVRKEISSLISALYGIGHNRVCVLKLSS